MRKCACVLAVLAFVVCAGASLAETMYARTSAKVREHTRLGARVIATLKQGDGVEVIEKSARHYRVSVMGRQGWVYYNKLAQQKPEDVATLLAQKPRLQHVSLDEIEAGGALRGLSPMAENYAKTAELPPWAKQAVEDMQSQKVTGDELEAFAREGGLGEYGEEQ